MEPIFIFKSVPMVHANFLNMLKNKIFLGLLLVIHAISLCFNVIYAQGDSAFFEKAEFYINTNECVNCHLFLKNYAIAYQNSDSVVLHLDTSAMTFGLNYLKSKGIEPATFDRVTYSGLNVKWGDTFESFIVIQQDGRYDTVMVKEPLIGYEEAGNTIMDSEKVGYACYSFSNRALVRATEGKVGIADEFLKKSSILISRPENLICVPDPFGLKSESLSQEYKAFFATAGLNMNLTEAMLPFMRQVDMADKVVTSIGFDDKNNFNVLVKHPYAFHTANRDTGLIHIFCVQSHEGKVLGYFDVFQNTDHQPYLNGFEPIFSFGITFYDDMVYVPLLKRTENLQKGDCILGAYQLDENGTYRFHSYTGFVMQKDHNNKNASINFSRDYAFLTQSAVIYSFKNKTKTSLNIKQTPDCLFWLHSLQELDDDTLLLLYTLCDEIIVSKYALSKAVNDVIWQGPNERNLIPVLQNHGLFLVKTTLGEPSYTYHALVY